MCDESTELQEEHTLKVRSSFAALLVALAGLMLFIAGCGDDDGDDGGSVEIPEVSIVGNDYTYDAPASIEGGLTRINFSNESPAEDHQAQLFRLNDGVSYADFADVLGDPESTEADILALVDTAAGGPGVAAGGESENVVDLNAGTYALICLIPSPTDDIPHFAKGMVQELEVTEPPEDQPEAPEADVAVGLSDFEFDAPETLEAGEMTFDVTNNGPQPHEMAVMRLDEGITTDDALGILSGEVELQGPPPFQFAGQVAVLTPGESATTTLDLEPGTYSLLCFVSDPESGAPHAFLGMAQDLVVE